MYRIHKRALIESVIWHEEAYNAVSAYSVTAAAAARGAQMARQQKQRNISKRRINIAAANETASARQHRDGVIGASAANMKSYHGSAIKAPVARHS